ncbi:MAG: BolA family transcriptional regulator [Porticoccaceae bacterium]|nr:BolA family transcriptional regulator [Porticoccaceae bacterium]|tara:strand:+ start:979 stop:1290 length:312 start_codon:yes stop_codon:yes gene_type:complete
MGPVEQSILSALEALKPSFLDLRNESSLHSVPNHSETHFKLIIVSDDFEGKRQVKRHQLVYGLLSDQLSGSVHALSMTTFTKDEWIDASWDIAESPNCMGGSC